MRNIPFCGQTPGKISKVSARPAGSASGVHGQLWPGIMRQGTGNLLREQTLQCVQLPGDCRRASPGWEGHRPCNRKDSRQRQVAYDGELPARDIIHRHVQQPFHEILIWNIPINSQ